MELPQAFYEQIGPAQYRPTAATTSPWDDRMQHGGPPSALALHALQRAQPRPDMLVARMIVDFLGVIPREEMSAQVAVIRPGRRIELARVTLHVRERAVVEAAVWRIATRGDIPIPPAVLARERADRPPQIPPPQTDTLPAGLAEWGYGRAIEWRFVRGGWLEHGPAGVWTRLRIPLVAQSVPSGIERIATVADSANGLSKELSLSEFTFVPTSIAITLDRAPAGEWTYLAAHTHIGSEGVGFTSSTLADEEGPLGVASQTLFFQPGGVQPQGGPTPSA